MVINCRAQRVLTPRSARGEWRTLSTTWLVEICCVLASGTASERTVIAGDSTLLNLLADIWRTARLRL
jgi:hypothetical protein